jgi:transposase
MGHDEAIAHQIKTGGSAMTLTILGIDLAKSAFHLHGTDARGHTVLRKRLSRSQLPSFLANLPRCVIAMEACGSAHYWARQIAHLGHTVRLINPQFVKAFIKSNKNDRNDAEAICEAAARPSMRFVPVKSVEQQETQQLHRARAQLIKNLCSLANQMRGFLAEHGIIVAKGFAPLRRALPELLEQPELNALFRELLGEMAERFRLLEERRLRYDKLIERVYRADERCQRLGQIEGVGPMTATALVAAIGDGKAFSTGLHLCAWLGLTPRQYSTAGRTVLLRISKRGDQYLRMLMVEGARSAIVAAARKSDPRSRWITGLAAKRGPCVTAVAVANRNARICWALLARGESYRAAAAGGKLRIVPLPAAGKNRVD